MHRARTYVADASVPRSSDVFSVTTAIISRSSHVMHLRTPAACRIQGCNSASRTYHRPLFLLRLFPNSKCDAPMFNPKFAVACLLPYIIIVFPCSVMLCFTIASSSVPAAPEPEVRSSLLPPAPAPAPAPRPRSLRSGKSARSVLILRSAFGRGFLYGAGFGFLLILASMACSGVCGDVQHRLADHPTTCQHINAEIDLAPSSNTQM